MKTKTFDNELRSIENVIEDRNFNARVCCTDNQISGTFCLRKISVYLKSFVSFHH